MSANLLIAGASVRAQVESALRAGLAVEAFDLFADRDTRFLISQEPNRCSSITPLKSFDDILSLEQKWSDCDVGITCGGIESRIKLVQALEKRIKLMGPTSKGLARLLDSVQVNQLLRQVLGRFGVSVPNTVASFGTEVEASKWISKKTGGSGGTGVALVEAGNVSTALPADHCGRYFQQRIFGESISVLYVSRSDHLATTPSDNTPMTSVIGLTEQLVGDENLGASRFQYCGSIGPYTLDREFGTTQIGLKKSEIVQIQRIGEFLARQYSLAGVWGIDFIVNKANAWPVDVNARLTASAELYESHVASTDSFKSILDLHLKACGYGGNSEVLDWDSVSRAGSGLVEGKAILFNRTDKAIPINDDLSDALMSHFDADFYGSRRVGMTVADVPCPGQSIKPGHPILTIRVRCPSSKETRFQLTQHAEEIYRSL